MSSEAFEKWWLANKWGAMTLTGVGLKMVALDAWETAAAPTPEVEPVAFAYVKGDDMDLRDGDELDGIYAHWGYQKTPLYDRPAPSELVKAVDLYLKAHDSDKSADKLIALGALRAAHDKVKS